MVKIHCHGVPQGPISGRQGWEWGRSNPSPNVRQARESLGGKEGDKIGKSLLCRWLKKVEKLHVHDPVDPPVEG